MSKSLTKVKLPRTISIKTAELIGIHLGDGSLCKDKKNNYTILYCGNLKKDKEYMDYINNLLLNLFNVKFKILINSNSNSIVLRLRSKNLFYYYKNYLNIEDGLKKDLSIPSYIKNNDKFLKVFLRGLFDTDGCVTLQKYGKYKYLLIKICTKHQNFAKEIHSSLNILGIPSFITKKESNGFYGYDVVIRNKNVKFFWSTIGSKNNRNIKKYKDLMGMLGFEFLK